MFKPCAIHLATTSTSRECPISPAPCQAGLRFFDLTALVVLTGTGGAHRHVTQICSAVEILVG